MNDEIQQIKVITDNESFQSAIGTTINPVVLFVLSKTCQVCNEIFKAIPDLISKRSKEVDIYVTFIGEGFPLEIELGIPGAPIMIGLVARQTVVQLSGYDITPENIDNAIAHMNKELKLLKKMPPVIKQIRFFLKSLLSLFSTNSILAKKTTIKDRMEVCKSCPFLVSSRCAACGCFVKAKTALANEKCIKGFW